MRVLSHCECVSILLLGLVGCSKPSTAPPTGLVKPPPAAFKAVEANRFEIYNVVATITLPKNNPTKSMLTGTSEDEKLAKPELKCQIACELGPGELADQVFNFTVQVEAPYHGYARMLHAYGSGTLERLKDGAFKADISLKQQLPLEITDKATLVFVANGNRKPLLNVDFRKGKVVLKQEE